MYDWPETAGAWDALWHRVRASLAGNGIEAAPELRRGGDPWTDWRDHALLLGQTCGWPYVSSLRGQVVPIARFDFGLSTTRPGDYHSVFIAPANTVSRADSLRDLAPNVTDGAAILAVNAPDSQSGFRVWGECFDEPFELPASQLLLTGSHRDSIRAVAAGRASLAAIDAVTWKIALAHEPAARDVVVIARSADVPGLPIIVSKDLTGYREKILASLKDALDSLPDAVRGPAGPRGIVPAADADYEVLTHPPFGNLRFG